MRCEERAAAVDGRFPIRFKCIRKLVVVNSEEELQRPVRNPVQKKFEPRVICNGSTRHETAPENAVISFVELLPVPNHVADIVRFVGHHDNYAIATRAIQAPDDCSSEPMRPAVLG